MKRISFYLPLFLFFTVLFAGAAAHASSAPALKNSMASEAPANAPAAKGAIDSAFSAHEGTWANWVAREIFYGGKPLKVAEHKGEPEVTNPHGVYYDYIVISVVLMILMGAVCAWGTKKVAIRPEGGAMSWPHLLESAVEGFHKFCVSVMGYDLAMKYSPLIASFFFTILLFNWIGLIPGLSGPTANPNVPFGLAIVGFFCVHFIAIREAGFKSYVMHYVGQPLWMAPLNIPLHIIGELVKPVSLAMRLLGNIFGDETVVAQFALLGLAFYFVPFQFPMMVMGAFMGLIQALIFAVLLAIYIAIFAVDHNAHDAHNEHGTTEEVRVYGHQEIVAHPSETTIA